MSRYISITVKEYVKHRDKNKCVYCGKRKRKWQFWRKPLEYGHVLPYSKGGQNCSENIQIECFKCNRKKGAEFVQLSWFKRWIRKEAKGCANKTCKHMR